MRKITWSLVILVAVGMILYGAFKYIKDFNAINTETDVSEGKEIKKEEYVYKEELLTLGYTVNDINFIQSKISESDVKAYLLIKKYDNLTSYIEIPYFNIKNVERYSNYKEKNKDYTAEQIVMYVEIGIDNDFYTNVTEITNYNDIDTLVNKYYKLPDNYEASDLELLESKYGNRKMKKVAAVAMRKMIDAASKDGYTLKVISGYRTQSQQSSLFNGYVKSDSLKNALLYSAKPGYSEHQTGYAADLNTVQDSFAKTKEYTWLKTNAFKYGFIERYPKDKMFITGYKYEPWHYRYVGVDIATKIYTEDITFEEYYVKYMK